MIVYGTLGAVEGTLLTAPSLMRVSSAVRSYDGGLRCGDVASVLPLSSGLAALVVIDVAGHGTARAPLSTSNSIGTACRSSPRCCRFGMPKNSTDESM